MVASVVEALKALELPMTGASQNEIKQQYKKLALKWHPDKNPSPDAKGRFEVVDNGFKYLKSIGGHIGDQSHRCQRKAAPCGAGFDFDSVYRDMMARAGEAKQAADAAYRRQQEANAEMLRKFQAAQAAKEQRAREKARERAKLYAEQPALHYEDLVSNLARVSRGRISADATVANRQAQYREGVETIMLNLAARFDIDLLRDISRHALNPNGLDLGGLKPPVNADPQYHCWPDRINGVIRYIMKAWRHCLENIDPEKAFSHKYAGLTNAELKNHLRVRNLTVSGNKKDMQERLWRADIGGLPEAEQKVTVLTQLYDALLTFDSLQNLADECFLLIYKDTGRPALIQMADRLLSADDSLQPNNSSRNKMKGIATVLANKCGTQAQGCSISTCLLPRAVLLIVKSIDSAGHLPDAIDKILDLLGGRHWHSMVKDTTRGSTGSQARLAFQDYTATLQKLNCACGGILRDSKIVVNHSRFARCDKLRRRLQKAFDPAAAATVADADSILNAPEPVRPEHRRHLLGVMACSLLRLKMVPWPTDGLAGAPEYVLAQKLLSRGHFAEGFVSVLRVLFPTMNITSNLAYGAFDRAPTRCVPPVVFNQARGLYSMLKDGFITQLVQFVANTAGPSGLIHVVKFLDPDVATAEGLRMAIELLCRDSFMAMEDRTSTRTLRVSLLHFILGGMAIDPKLISDMNLRKLVDKLWIRELVIAAESLLFTVPMPAINYKHSSNARACDLGPQNVPLAKRFVRTALRKAWETFDGRDVEKGASNVLEIAIVVAHVEGYAALKEQVEYIIAKETRLGIHLKHASAPWSVVQDYLAAATLLRQVSTGGVCLRFMRHCLRMPLFFGKALLWAHEKDQLMHTQALFKQHVLELLVLLPTVAPVLKPARFVFELLQFLHSGRADRARRRAGAVLALFNGFFQHALKSMDSLEGYTLARVCIQATLTLASQLTKSKYLSYLSSSSSPASSSSASLSLSLSASSSSSSRSQPQVSSQSAGVCLFSKGPRASLLQQQVEFLLDLNLPLWLLTHAARWLAAHQQHGLAARLTLTALEMPDIPTDLENDKKDGLVRSPQNEMRTQEKAECVNLLLKALTKAQATNTKKRGLREGVKGGETTNRSGEGRGEKGEKADEKMAVLIPFMRLFPERTVDPDDLPTDLNLNLFEQRNTPPPLASIVALADKCFLGGEFQMFPSFLQRHQAPAALKMVMRRIANVKECLSLIGCLANLLVAERRKANRARANALGSKDVQKPVNVLASMSAQLYSEACHGLLDRLFFPKKVVFSSGVNTNGTTNDDVATHHDKSTTPPTDNALASKTSKPSKEPLPFTWCAHGTCNTLRCRPLHAQFLLQAKAVRELAFKSGRGAELSGLYRILKNQPRLQSLRSRLQALENGARPDEVSALLRPGLTHSRQSKSRPEARVRDRLTISIGLSSSSTSTSTTTTTRATPGVSSASPDFFSLASHLKTKQKQSRSHPSQLEPLSTTSTSPSTPTSISTSTVKLSRLGTPFSNHKHTTPQKSPQHTPSPSEQRESQIAEEKRKHKEKVREWQRARKRKMEAKGEGEDKRKAGGIPSIKSFGSFAANRSFAGVAKKRKATSSILKKRAGLWST